MCRCSTAVFLLVALGWASSFCPAQAEEVFFAREFSYTREFKTGIDLLPQGFPIALQPRGIYVAGTFFTGVGSAGPETQGLIRRYDSSGNAMWTRQIPAAGGAFPSLMAVEATALYVAGHIGFGHTDLFVRKYEEGGNELWARQLRISDGGYHVATGLAADASGAYVAGWNGFSQGVLRKYSPAGDELWSRPMTVFNVGGVAVDVSGVYVAGWTDRSGGFVRKYSAGGEELWTRQVGTGGVLAADSTRVYVGGALVAKLDPSGKEVWRRQLGLSDRDYLGALAVDGTGVYAAGGTERALPGQCKAGSGDVFVRKYDFDGNEQGTRQFGTSGRDFLGGVAVDGTGVYVGGGIRGGPAHGNVFVTKLAKTPTPASDSRPQIWQECVVNAASYAGGGVAPGEIVTIFGRAMGPAELSPLRLGGDGRLATTLGDTRILFNGIAAPLVYVSATQSSAIVPYAVAEKSTVTVEVEYRGVRSDALLLPVAAARPGVFTFDSSGSGEGAILNADGSLNSAANAAERGSIIVLYLTGEGLSDPASADGAILGGALPKPRLPVSVWFEDPKTGDGDSAEVVYAGGVSGSVAGLLQVNVRVPTWARSGNAVPFYVQIDSEPAESGFTVALR